MIGMGGQAVISARSRGADLVTVAGMVNKMNYIFVVRHQIKSPEDLKGKRDRHQPDRHGFLSCGGSSTETVAFGRASRPNHDSTGGDAVGPSSFYKFRR